MREMKDSGVQWIGEIPIEWNTIHLRHIAEIETGNMDTQNNDPDGDYPFYVRSPIVERSNDYTFDDIEAILMAGDGVGAGRVFHLVHGKYGCHQRVYRMNNFKYAKAEYLKYYLESIFPFIMDQGSAKSTVDSVRLPMLKSFSVVVPSLAEQSNIVAYLDRCCATIDALIANQQQQIDKLKQYKQAVITEAVTRGLDPNVRMKDSGVEWIGEVPEHWSIKKFSYCARIMSNLVDPVQYLDLPQIAPDSIEKGAGKLSRAVQTVREAGVVSWNHLFRKGQIIYSKIRPLLNKLIIAPFDGLCSADMYPIETDNNTAFIAYAMLSNYFVSQVGLFVANRVKMPKINQEELASIMIALPSLQEQQAITRFLDERCSQIDVLITLKQQKADKLAQYKKSLIYEVVTGKREV